MLVVLLLAGLYKQAGKMEKDKRKWLEEQRNAYEDVCLLTVAQVNISFLGNKHEEVQNIG